MIPREKAEAVVAKVAAHPDAASAQLWLNQAESHSGWRLAVAIGDPSQLTDAVQRLLDVAQNRGLGLAVAAPQTLGDTAAAAVTITLPHRATRAMDIAAVDAALAGTNSGAQFPGHVAQGHGIGARFDMTQDLGRDATPAEAAAMFASPGAEAAVATPVYLQPPPDYAESDVPMILQMLAQDNHMTFLPVYTPETMAGHKLHVYCDTVEDVAEVLNRVSRVVHERGMGMKIGTNALMTNRSEDDPQKHKGVTIYLPHRSTIDADTAAVVETMRGYHHDRGIAGDDYIGAGVSHRVEVARDRGHTLSLDQYAFAYRAAPEKVAYDAATDRGRDLG